MVAPFCGRWQSWPSGLRRTLQVRVRKSVGSNPTDCNVVFFVFLSGSYILGGLAERGVQGRVCGSLIVEKAGCCGSGGFDTAIPHL